MQKKTLITLLIVGAVIAIAIVIYFLWFTTPTNQTGNPITRNPLWPFGNYNNASSSIPVAPVIPTTKSTSTTYTNTPTSLLFKISTEPIAGAEVIDRKSTGTTTKNIVRYVERGTGHVIEYDRQENSLITVSNTTIPTIYKATWSGNSVIAQYLDKDHETIKTFSGIILATTSASTTSLVGTLLEDNIYSLAIAPKGGRIFTLKKQDVAEGTISNMSGEKKTSIFNFPFNEWVVQWPNETTLALTTKASASASGYMYFLTTDGVMTKALGNVAGLTSLTSPNLDNIIYSGSINDSFATGVYNVTKRSTLTFTNTPTLPAKCVWSKLNKLMAYCAIPTSIPVGNYPDDWYQGKVNFVDNIYRINLALPAVQLLYTLPKNLNIDAFDLFLDSKEETLYFTNKTDYYLWGLSIKTLIPVGL